MVPSTPCTITTADSTLVVLSTLAEDNPTPGVWLASRSLSTMTSRMTRPLSLWAPTLTLPTPTPLPNLTAGSTSLVTLTRLPVSRLPLAWPGSTWTTSTGLGCCLNAGENVIPTGILSTTPSTPTPSTLLNPRPGKLAPRPTLALVLAPGPSGLMAMFCLSTLALTSLCGMAKTGRRCLVTTPLTLPLAPPTVAKSLPTRATRSSGSTPTMVTLPTMTPLPRLAVGSMSTIWTMLTGSRDAVASTVTLEATLPSTPLTLPPWLLSLPWS
mmetsp:Transcript_104142/g.145019  ORF Transcript_104142/g.145019 Transcript_104142/m.145019 type:complete len:269 (+) Transcript_104142:1241-2047(+)